MAQNRVYPDEDVLCVSTADLFRSTERWRGIRKDSPSIWEPIMENSFFKKRALVEEDPSLKQLISYTIFVSGTKIFVMRRLSTQSEKRLQGLLSIGVGGHMNPVPEIPWPGDRDLGHLKEIVWINTLREIREEVAMAGSPGLKIMGFLNDDSNKVGEVHLGVVSLVHLPSPILAVRETDKMVGTWVEVKDLESQGTFETWSSLIIGGL